jgi:hypothetical protein
MSQEKRKFSVEDTAPVSNWKCFGAQVKISHLLQPKENDNRKGMQDLPHLKVGWFTVCTLDCRHKKLHIRPLQYSVYPAPQRCGPVTIFYGSGSGSDF